MWTCPAGAVAPEAIAAVGLLAEHRRDVGVLAVTSADRLFAGWRAAETARMAGGTPPPSQVERHRVKALGVDRFGQTGSIQGVYGTYGLDSAAILRAAQAGSPDAPLPV